MRTIAGAALIVLTLGACAACPPRGNEKLLDYLETASPNWQMDDDQRHALHTVIKAERLALEEAE